MTVLDHDEREQQIRYYIAMYFPPISMSLVWQRIARRQAEIKVDSGWRYPNGTTR